MKECNEVSMMTDCEHLVLRIIREKGSTVYDLGSSLVLIEDIEQDGAVVKIVCEECKPEFVPK
jgi:hypothetical protein